jgi:hypothetical protein
MNFLDDMVSTMQKLDVVNYNAITSVLLEGGEIN